MQKDNIIHELTKRAREQKIIQNVPFPNMFLFFSRTLGENPWKILLPFSLCIAMLLHFIFGRNFDAFILWLFSL